MVRAQPNPGTQIKPQLKTEVFLQVDTRKDSLQRKTLPLLTDVSPVFPDSKKK
jgi:hypothetical protein